MQTLFGKEKALYLVENSTKIGFSWWFFVSGVIAAYWIHVFYGDSHFVIMVVEKYVFLAVTLFFGFLRVWVTRSVKSGRMARDSQMLYLVPLFGYASTFFGTIGFSHMAFAVFNR